jgi:hypothetical protein
MFEMIISISIFLMLVMLISGVDIGFLERNSIQDESELVHLLLVRARSDAMNYVCHESSCASAPSHGVHIENGTAILFEGDQFRVDGPMNESYAISHVVSKTPFEITFLAGSGDARVLQGDGQVVLGDGLSTSTILVGNAGQINIGK